MERRQGFGRRSCKILRLRLDVLERKEEEEGKKKKKKKKKQNMANISARIKFELFYRYANLLGQTLLASRVCT
jgi:hypothetical protein